MHIHVQATDEQDTRTALGRLTARLAEERAAPPGFLSVYASAAHDADLVRGAFAGSGATSVHGGTSCQGVMAGGRMIARDGYGIGYFALWDEDGAFGTGLAPLGGDPRAAARAAVIEALDMARRPGETPELIWLTAAPGAEEALIAGIEDVVGANAPILGGSAADNDLTGGWRVFDTTRAETAGVAVSVLFPSSQVASAYQSGYVPTAKSGKVTRAAGRRIQQIDDRPAAEVYAGWTDGAVAADAAHAAEGPAMILSESTLHPLGRHVGDVADVPFYLLAHPATVHPDGSIELFADLDEGERVTLMTGSPDSLVSRAGRVASLSAQRGGFAVDDIAGALVIFCGGCMLAVRDRMDTVADEVDRALGGAPSLGIFTFGEQGAVLGEQNCHGNLMISCVTFAR
ncbi:MAG: FIST C-terminal domain-containing protein [Pseudomonadota bacterium]